MIKFAFSSDGDRYYISWIAPTKIDEPHYKEIMEQLDAELVFNMGVN